MEKLIKECWCAARRLAPATRLLRRRVWFRPAAVSAQLAAACARLFMMIGVLADPP